MSMSGYAISHQRLSSSAMALIKEQSAALSELMLKFGVTPKGLSAYNSYGLDLSDLTANLEEGIETAVEEAYSIPLEELPKQLTNQGLGEVQKLIVKERLQGIEDKELEELASNFDEHAWVIAFESRYDKIREEMEKVLGLPIYPYADQEGDLYWAVEHSDLFDPSPKHKALKKLLGKKDVVFNDTWVEYG